ncbi:glycosyltransferase [Thermoplasmatales archaeon AK]|nr:glycosyltransferase [Thermoplasmatales archaeon AK]
MGVLQITNVVNNTSIGKFSKTLHAASSAFSEVYYFRITRQAQKTCDWAKTCSGIYLPFGSSWFINTRFRDVTFRTYLREIRKKAKGGEFIHYTSQVVIPIREISYATVTVHDLYFAEFPENFDTSFVRLVKANISIYKNIEHINCFSQTMARNIENLGFAGKITVLPHPLFEDFIPIRNKIEIRKELGLPVDRKIILSISTAEKRKNLRIVKEVTERIGDDYLLVRVGPSIGLGVTYNQVDGYTLIKLYNAADVLLMPSLFEGYGVPVIEALACELPVVASDLEVFHEIAGNNALYFDPHDANDVIRTVREVVSGFEVDKSFAAGIRENHSFRKFSESLLTYYRYTGAIA